MNEKTASHVRDAQDAWKKAMADQVARMEVAYGEMARMQEQSLEQSQKAVDGMAKLAMDSFGYFGQLATEWRKLTLDAAKKAADLTTPQG